MRATRRQIIAGAGSALMSPGSALLAQAPVPELGRRLFANVQAYSRWPHHRTGTPEERDTVEWFEQSLKRAGAASSRWSYDFPRYDWSATVHAAGHLIEVLPLWYEGVGEIATSAPFVRPVTLANNFDKRDIAQALREARGDDARLAILPTFGSFESEGRRPALIACNVDPDTAKSGLPALLASGADLDLLAAGPLSAVLSAKRTEARADNVVARFGTGERPLLITTPISGWFTCAGERGTGIAVALELASELAKRVPVVVIGTTGHELENFGIRRQLAAGLGLAPRAILHIGASLAAGNRQPDGSLRLASTRYAVSSRPSSDAYAEALRRGEFQAFDRFLGEAADWSRALPEIPLLSFAGSFRQFHTPEDKPEASTTPALLAQVYEAVRDATTAVLAL